MSEKHIGEVVQVIGPVLDIRFGHDELPALLNAIEIDHEAPGSQRRLPSRSGIIQCAVLQ